MSNQAPPSIGRKPALALMGAALLCASCGTATTALDGRCADLAATGYTPQAKLEALLEAAQQPTNGDPDAIRRQAKAFCEQLGSGNLAQP